MKNTNTLWKFNLMEHLPSFKNVGEVVSYTVSMILTIAITVTAVAIPVIVLVTFFRLVSSIL